MHISIKPDILFHVLGLPITNTLLTAWIVIVILVVGSWLVTRNLKDIPGQIQNFFEWTIDTMMYYLGVMAGSRDMARKYFPLLATVFIFILACNWIGLIPGFSSIGFSQMHHGKEVFVPLFRTANASLNVTFALTIIVLLFSHVVGIKVQGIKNHLGRFINFSSPMNFFVGILEAISEFAKFISLSFRLFGNIFAGEVLLAIMSFLLPYIIPVPFYGLELFEGIIQAAIFAALGMSYLMAMRRLPASH